MRNNIAKHVVIGLISASAVVSLVGSISGTLAWYLNSNTAMLSFIGASVYATQSLEMSLGDDDDYTANKDTSTVQEYAIGGQYVTASKAAVFDANADYYTLGSEIGTESDPGPLVYYDEETSKYYELEYVTEPVAGNLSSYYNVSSYGGYNHNGVNFKPVTPGVTMASNAALPNTPMYQMPQLGGFEYSTWALATGQEYLQFPINMRARVVDGSVTPELLRHNVYLTDLTVEVTVNDGDLAAADFLNALRIHYELITPGQPTTDVLLSHTPGVTNLYGTLDLAHDGDGIDDTYKYVPVYESNPLYNTVGVYGATGRTQTTLAWDDFSRAEDTGGTIVTHGASPIGTTTLSPLTPFQLVVTIWVESWALLPISSWTNYDASFNVGMTFSVESMDAAL